MESRPRSFWEALLLLEFHGMTPEKWEDIVNLDLQDLRRIVDSIPPRGPVLDAGQLLGIGPAATELPRGVPGKITLVVPTPMFLIALRDSDVGKELIHRQDWYDGESFAATPVPAGTYHIRLPIPGSNDRMFNKQRELLLPGEAPIPVALAAAVLLCLQKAGLADPLHGAWVRCQEATTVGGRVELTWRDGRLHVDHDWHGYRFDLVWLASARTSGGDPCPLNP